MIECGHWSACGVTGGGCCAAGYWGGKPSLGICRTVCRLGVNPKTLEPPEETPVEPPAPSKMGVRRRLRQVATAAMALAVGQRVPDVIAARRVKVCELCDKLDRDERGMPVCGVCGCSVAPDLKRHLNLARFEENLPAWGCKHPQRDTNRAEGQAWNHKGWPTREELVDPPAEWMLDEGV
jgi:hypothetical protein